MNTAFEKYLNTVDKCLKPLPASERVDIVKEIKSSILEMERENLSTEQILERLGKPKELARAYLGDLISKEKGFSWKRILLICAFYSVVGFSGLVVIPCLGIIAPVFLVCGAVTPLLGAVKLTDFLLQKSQQNKKRFIYLRCWLQKRSGFFTNTITVAGIISGVCCNFEFISCSA